MPYQLMYSSQTTDPMSAISLEQILAEARTDNAKRNITGALVYADGVFFQILEGDKEVVRNLMADIAQDDRHHSVKVFYEAEVEARAFDSWSMGYLSTTAGQMSAWAGLPGSTTVEALLAEIKRNPERVPHILVSVLNALVERSS